MRDTRLPAKRGACALILCGLVAAPAASAQSSGGGTVYVATPKVAKVTCLRKCASKNRARGGSVLKIVGSALGGVNTVTYLGSYGSGDDTTVKVRAGSDSRINARVPIGAVTGPIALATCGRRALRPHQAGPHPAAAAARAERRAVARAGTGRGRRTPARDRHQPHQGVRGRPAGSDVLVPALGGVGRGAQGRAGERGRRSRGEDLDAAAGGPGPGPEHLVERAAGQRGREAGPLLVPPHRGERGRRRGAQLAGGRRRPRLVRPLRQHLPDPRPARLRRRGRASSAPAGQGTSTRDRTYSRSAGRAWWRPAAGA